MAKLIRLDATGHTVLKEWTTDSPATVSDAKTVFDRIMEAERPLAYDAKTNTALKQFDPEAETIILTPQLVGG